MRTQRAVLLSVIALHLIADNSLSPFYPQLFHRLFGVTDLTATGGYVWACRLAAVLALPLWGLAARRWPAHRLVVAGLLAAAGLDLALAASPSYAVFTGLSVALVAATMSMALAYPALVALDDGADRLPRVREFAVVVQLATIAATLVGAGLMALPQVRWGLAAFGLVDLVLAWSCWRVLDRACAGRRVPDRAPTGPRRSAPPSEHVEPPSTPRRSPMTVALRAVAVVAVLTFAAEFGRGVVRPFFTAYADAAGAGPLAAAVLFLLPSIAILAVLPLAEAARARLGPALLPVAFLLAAGGLAVQALPGQPLWLAGGRLLLGAGLGLGQIALDLRIFDATRARGAEFAVVETARNVALLASPVAATAAATVALPAPLLVGAAVFAAVAAVLAITDRRAATRRRRVPLAVKEPRATHPVH